MEQRNNGRQWNSYAEGIKTILHVKHKALIQYKSTSLMASFMGYLKMVFEQV
jgi:hypothetical protein